MSLKIRRIIMFSFIGAFFILAPIILFYTSGYRLDLKRYQVLKTGTLFIEAKDIKKADLYINDEKLPDTFSTKKYIYNLLPGEYTIKITKDGYHDWEKKAVIYSGLTTFIQDAILFRNEVPMQIIDAKIIDFSTSPDWTKIVYTIANDPFEEIYLFDLATKQKTLLYRLPMPKTAPKIRWAASSKKILLAADDNYVIIDIENPKNLYSLKNIINTDTAQIQWDAQSDSVLYAQTDTIIYKIDLFAKTSAEFYTTSDLKLNPAFYIDGPDLYYINQSNSQNVLEKYNFQFKTTKKVSDLSKATNYKFIPSHNNFLGLIDLDQQKLYLIRKTSTNLDLGLNNESALQEFKAKDAVWDDQEKQLIYYDDFEISTYNTDENKEQFINRYGQLIKKISWYPDLEHFVILQDNHLNIIDTTQAVGTRNTTELTKFDRLENFYLDNKGENLYFNGQIGKQQGLYQLILK